MKMITMMLMMIPESKDGINLRTMLLHMRRPNRHSKLGGHEPTRFLVVAVAVFQETKLPNLIKGKIGAFLFKIT